MSLRSIKFQQDVTQFPVDQLFYISEEMNSKPLQVALYEVKI